MDKYEFNIKVTQIKKLVSKGDYETAMKIADTIDWRRVRNGNLLSMVAIVYEKNEDYQVAREILLMAFERAPIGKRLLYKLAELALLEGNIEEAEAYYREFGELAGDDPRQLLLRYMILKAKGAPAQQLIHSLESYTSQEIDEKWLYELAELYSLADMPDRCVQTCDRIMLMFGLGKYVEKAMELKVQYAPLTSYQMDLVENRDKYEAKLRAVEEEYNPGSKAALQGQGEEYYDDEASDTEITEEPYYDNLEASIQEAEVQEDLAREMSQISYEDQPYEESSEGAGNTRELDDFKEVNRHSESHGGDASMAAGEAATVAGEAAVTAGRTAAGEGVAVDLTGARLAGATPRSHGRGSWPKDDGELYGEPIIEEDDADDNEWEPYLEEGRPENGESQNEVVPSDYDERVDEYQESTLGDSMSEAGHKGEKSSNPADGVSKEDTTEMDDLEMERLEDETREPSILHHLMIRAVTPEKGLEIAIESLKRLHRKAGVKNPVAKITGGKLSKLGVWASAGRLSGKDLVIEEAGDLSQAALDQLDELLNKDMSGMNVVLIDNPMQIEDLCRNHPVLADKFECINGDEEDGENKGEDGGEDGGKEEDLVPGTKIPVQRPRPSSTLKHEEGKESPRPVTIKASGIASAKRGPLLRPAAESVSTRLNARESIIKQPSGKAEMDSAPYRSSVPRENQAAAAYEADLHREASDHGTAPRHEASDRNAAPYDTDSYEANNFDEFDGEEEMLNQKKGLFGGNKKRVYKELPPEEPYADEDYYVESEEEPVLARDQEGPGSHGEEMGIDEFAQYACRYANDIDCSITGKSMLALYERIEIMEEDGVPLTRVNAENIIEEAADRAEKPSIGKRVKGIFTTKYDKDGFLILKEEHFIY